MSEENPQECTEPVEPKAKPAPEKTSDYYHVSEQLPDRFNNPAWFRGYRTDKAISMYSTSNQTYGSRVPTVHEMPKVFYPSSIKFSRQLAACGMFQSNTFNVGLEKSIVTGPDNLITHCDRLNFHPSYNVNRPSICD
ncbi:piercer of microtubule wall 1 protein [Acomys russatus]|uniref:piercer of microtubule wall 1 protein n=1 Tax=Acomys russatus TaxID=60746 RepID=UPI0021E2294F|nr:piercer of microtubule wall 1 protein [Acomys russatus]